MLTKDGVGWVHCYLVLSSISNQSLGVGETNIAGSGTVSLVIGDDFNLAMLEHSHTGIGCSKVDTNCVILAHFCCFGLENINSYCYPINVFYNFYLRDNLNIYSGLKKF